MNGLTCSPFPTSVWQAPVSWMNLGPGRARPRCGTRPPSAPTAPFVAGRATERGSSFGAARPARVTAIVAVIVVGLAGLTLLLYFTSAHFRAATSDTATIVLEGRSMANGHVLLHGWNLTFASFWTSTALFEAIVILIAGLHPGVMYLGPALVGALCVAAGAVLARRDAHGGAAAAAVATVVALLVFSPPAFDYFFVGHGFHVSTAAYALVAFVLLQRRSFGLAWLAAVILMGLGMLGDMMMIAYASIPLVAFAIVAAAHERRWRAGLVEGAAGAASVAFAAVVRRIFDALGTFRSVPVLSLDHRHQILANLAHVPLYVASLLGLTHTVIADGAVPASLGLMDDLGAAHVIAAVLVLVCFAVALGRLVTGVIRPRREGLLHDEDPSWRVDDLNVLAVICAACPFVVLGGHHGGGTRYLTASVIFAIVLAGRMIARAYAAIARPAFTRALAGAGVALGLGLAASFGSAVASSTPTNPDTQLAAFLETHHLHSGLGGYWEASITTVSTSGKVAVRPVSATRSGHILRMRNLSSADWYQGKTFQFFVWEHGGNVESRAAYLTWGRPEHTYVVGRYYVLVWNHLLRVPAEPTTS